MSFEIKGNYIIAQASLDRATEIVEEVNQAYGACFNKYLVDTLEHPIDRTNEDKIKSMISDSSMTLYVLINKTNNAIAGTICYVPTQKEEQGYFGLFSLSGEVKGREIGAGMISFIENRARTEGKKRMKIDVSGFARNLHQYYERLGYQKTGKTLAFDKGIHWQLKSEYEGSENANFVVFKKLLTD